MVKREQDEAYRLSLEADRKKVCECSCILSKRAYIMVQVIWICKFYLFVERSTGARRSRTSTSRTNQERARRRTGGEDWLYSFSYLPQIKLSSRLYYYAIRWTVQLPIKHGLIVDSPKNDLRNFKGFSNRVEFNSEAIVPGPFLFPAAEQVLFCGPGAVEEEFTSVCSVNCALC